ncbi:23S rRNA (pseudouridine(1915)-N(3))-methyltransferase RlmH [uncultured Roseobacter sp.]|uniref:23S rRNA (pseudouridine(1915)-N(3))-methyltransferase RlmH n=1 Tax=uncultured Roseobacter sp. TaxID=114847 RepID=UPI00261C9A56|nr:23S rRNA (pseudouridine(1915)-N(3))-methyltransferase RlmH [uncultured Roseobacter sp.]
MRVHIIAVGRLKAGPQQVLIDDYLTRFDRTGRALGLGPAQVVQLDERKGGSKAGEAALVRRALPGGAVVVALDERGAVISSPAFAQKLGGWRDNGARDLALLIGGADGLDPALCADADARLSLGKMVWPHMLVRVMIAEQLYRAASILASAPYHRD